MRNAALIAILLASCAEAPSRPDRERLAERLAAGPEEADRALAELAAAGATVEEALRTREDELRAWREASESLREGLEAAAKSPSYATMLAESARLLRRACLAREWEALRPALARQGFGWVEMYEPHEHAKSLRFIARREAFVTDRGDRHDLFFWIHVAREGPGAPWGVRHVEAGLHAALNAPFERLALRYPAGTVLERFFELPELAKLAEVHPVVEEIELLYDRLGRGWGYHVNASFVGGGSGRGVYFTADDQGGKPGPFHPRASSVWGLPLRRR